MGTLLCRQARHDRDRAYGEVRTWPVGFPAVSAGTSTAKFDLTTDCDGGAKNPLASFVMLQQFSFPSDDRNKE